MEQALIRKGVPRDLPATLDLIRELAVYEKAPEAVITTVESMEKDGFGPDKVFDLWVCELRGEILGIALCYVRYSTWKGRCMYLEDLVVREAHRGKGYGALLFEEVMRETRRRGYAQMQWQVLDWNEPALNFYRKYGATLDGEWINGILTQQDIEGAGF
ncbi:MAG: GNAT family N-acetyltransferase [Cryomorphaceae bacterium]|nr:MAG: GNAT family N-acetyltransferase [Cryomorphaceae bacterium]